MQNTVLRAAKDTSLFAEAIFTDLSDTLRHSALNDAFVTFR